MLRRALASVQAQTFDGLVEVVVVDDGSLDGTAAWLQAHAPEIRLVVSTSPGGAAAARNRALGEIDGELIAFLDSDDVWRPTYLEDQVSNLDQRPDAVISHADYVLVDPAGGATRPTNGTLLPDADALVRLLAECFIHTQSTMICRREAIDRFGRFDEGLAVVHDFDWYARVLAGGGVIAHLPRPLVERSVPGGLITDHRRWFGEERTMIGRALAASEGARRARPMIRAYRSLWFARVALAKGDVAFGLARLAEALLQSPRWTAKLAALSLARRARGEHRMPAPEALAVPLEEMGAPPMAPGQPEAAR
jgi:glycosyltransferase involved in cell wall biosynthesis